MALEVPVIVATASGKQSKLLRAGRCVLPDDPEADARIARLERAKWGRGQE